MPTVGLTNMIIRVCINFVWFVYGKHEVGTGQIIEQLQSATLRDTSRVFEITKYRR
jgi:hypothetical protein